MLASEFLAGHRVHPGEVFDGPDGAPTSPA
jgi:hypothetical protein